MQFEHSKLRLRAGGKSYGCFILRYADLWKKNAVDSSYGLRYAPCLRHTRPFLAAAFNFCPMPNAHSSLDDIICTSFVAACVALCPMPPTYSSILSLPLATFDTACFDLCSVPHTYSSIYDLICASISRTFLSTSSLLLARMSPHLSSSSSSLAAGDRSFLFEPAFLSAALAMRHHHE